MFNYLKGIGKFKTELTEFDQSCVVSSPKQIKMRGGEKVNVLVQDSEKVEESER